MRAVLAARHMAAERRGATALDGRHHLQLVEAKVSGIGRPPRCPVIAEDIRDLQRWTEHGRGQLRRRRIFPVPAGPVINFIFLILYKLFKKKGDRARTFTAIQ